MRIAGSLPRLPQRLMVKGETRKRSATSRTVKRSGKFSMDNLFLLELAVTFIGILIRTISECFDCCQEWFLRIVLFDGQSDFNVLTIR